MGAHEAAGLLIAALQAMGGWKLGILFIAGFLLPLAVNLYLVREAITAIVKLREEVKESIRESNRRYDNNVILVEQYEQISHDLLAVVKSNTEAFIHLSDIIEQRAKRRTP